MENEDASINLFVNEIWHSYDLDGSGKIDREECEKFLSELLPEMKDGYRFSIKHFEKIFQEFDLDGSGEISKAEMADFIKRAFNSDKADATGAERDEQSSFSVEHSIEQPLQKL